MSSFSGDDEDDKFFADLDEVELLMSEDDEQGNGEVGSNKAELLEFGEWDQEDEEGQLSPIMSYSGSKLLIIEPGTSVAPAVGRGRPWSSSSAAAAAQRQQRQDTTTPFDLEIKDTAKEETPAWKDFVKWFNAQSKFSTSLFEVVPVPTLNVIECQTLISAVKAEDTYQLVNCAKMLVTFLKGITRDCGGEDGHFTFSASEYYGQILHLMDIVFLKIEKNRLCGQLTKSEQTELCKVIEEIFAGNSKMDLEKFKETSIPQTLARLHPKVFEGLVRKSIASQNVEMLVPFCSNADNFVKTLEILHSGRCNSETNDGGGYFMEEDIDFQDVIRDEPHHVPFLRKLVEALKVKTGSEEFIKYLPTNFQPLFSLEAAILSKDPKLFENETLLKEIFHQLNAIFYECKNCNLTEEFAKLILSISIHISKVLDNEQIRKKITLKEYPYFWKVLRKTGKGIQRK